MQCIIALQKKQELPALCLNVCIAYGHPPVMGVSTLVFSVGGAAAAAAGLRLLVPRYSKNFQ